MNEHLGKPLTKHDLVLCLIMLPSCRPVIVSQPAVNNYVKFLKYILSTYYGRHCAKCCTWIVCIMLPFRGILTLYYWQGNWVLEIPGNLPVVTQLAKERDGFRAGLKLRMSVPKTQALNLSHILLTFSVNGGLHEAKRMQSTRAVSQRAT